MTKARRILISASLFHALNDSATVAVPMVFPILLGRGLMIRNYSQIGLLSNFGLLATFLFQILIVLAARRWDFRTMLGVSLAGIVTSLVLIPLSTTYAWLFSLYILFRVFDSFYHTIGLAWVSRTHPSQGIDFAMGVQSGSGNLGVLLAFIAVGFMAQHTKWQTALLAWAAVCLGLGLVSLALVRRVSFSMDDDDEGLGPGSWFRTIKLIRSYIPGFVFGGASWSVTVYFAPSLLNRKFGVPMGGTGLYLAVWIGMGTVMTYLFGRLSRACGRSNITRAALAVASLALFGVGLADRTALAVTGLFLFGISLFLIYPALQSCVGNAVASRYQSQAFSVASNLQILSGALVSLVSGYLSDRFGVNSPFLLMGGLGLIALALSPPEGGRPGAGHLGSSSSRS
jgi:predicted MFS family arabinose efflux permease